MKRLLLVTMMLVLTACEGEPPTTTSDESLIDPLASKESVSIETEQNAEPLDDSGVDKSNADWKSNLELPALMSFEPGQDIFWKLETNVGDMTFKLFPDIAPMHVTSTIYLTELGFYDDLIFHRVITGFMAQGGDPLGVGQGGPGYQYDGEFSPQASHDRPGLLSMANRGPGTDGSQFFITFSPTPWLDGKHTIFGEIVSGQATIAELEKRGSRSGTTSERLVIVRASIEEAM